MNHRKKVLKMFRNWYVLYIETVKERLCAVCDCKQSLSNRTNIIEQIQLLVVQPNLIVAGQLVIFENSD